MDAQRRFRDETADRFFRRIHVTYVLRERGYTSFAYIRVSYMRTPRGYQPDCEWIVPGTLDLEA